MIHIRKEVKHPQKKGARIVAQCDAKLGDEDTLTETAFASNCDDCRTAVGVGGQYATTWEGKKLGVRPAFVADLQTDPLRDADGKIYEREKL